ELYLDTVDQAIARLVNENEIHAFVFVLQLCQLTDTDKMGLEWLQRTFGESVLPFVMILFTYEKEEDHDTIIDDLKKNPVLEQLLQKCGDRYYTCSRSMSNQTEMKTLLEKIDHMISENNQRCYTAELYNAASNLRERLQDSKKQQSAWSSQQQKDDGDSAASTQITETEKVSKTSSIFKTIKSISHIAWDKIKGHTPSVETVELEVAVHPQQNNEEEEKLLGKQIDQLFTRLQLEKNQQQKLKTADVLQITAQSLSFQDSCREKELVKTFLQRLLLVDYRARNITVSEKDQRQSGKTEKDEDDTWASFIKTKSELDDGRSEDHIDPMDVQMAVFHCSDNFLKQLIVTKLSQCQYALPLLVQNPFTGETEFPLWTFRQIRKSWKTCEISSGRTSKTKPIYEAETPMVVFFRIGSISSSKSQLINSLINEKHDTFFHRDCP
ncbi:hypothetical protein AOLI_G00319320, partial [Acnodon oligacanthus]